ncbi:hypothetical protein GOD78_10965 [Sinorhizobium medicae]|nr:hypothetical protein [Sinorhizobium medicae]MDX0818038.1 hypothetical protein [Sinorhizobium medicae]
MAPNEGLQNISLQVPLSLARRLDVRCEIERRASPGTGSRSTVIRAALDHFLADIPDPKRETVAPPRKNAATTSADATDNRPYRPPMAPRRSRKADTAPVLPPVRTRQRPAPQINTNAD